MLGQFFLSKLLWVLVLVLGLGLLDLDLDLDLNLDLLGFGLGLGLLSLGLVLGLLGLGLVLGLGLSLGLLELAWAWVLVLPWSSLTFSVFPLVLWDWYLSCILLLLLCQLAEGGGGGLDWIGKDKSPSVGKGTCPSSVVPKLLHSLAGFCRGSFQLPVNLVHKGF